MLDELKQLKEQVSQLYDHLYDSRYQTERSVRSIAGRPYRTPYEPPTQPGLVQAICCDTIDPHHAGRVRYFVPGQTELPTQIGSLNFARPISNMGGFDDCGCTWVPPAGSRLMLAFEFADRRQAYYLGTSWTVNRGTSANPYDLGYPVPEFQKLWNNRGEGYLAGDTTGRQDYMPWNGELYNAQDPTNAAQDFESDPNALQNITYPHLYGFKTPGKHLYKQDDGDHLCNDRWKRVEMMSARGNYLLFKDDHLHPAGQWANPKACGNDPSADASMCHTPVSGDFDPTKLTQTMPIEMTDCQGSSSNSSIDKTTTCANKYFKRVEECRPFTSQRYQPLPQSGIELQSLSGHTFMMDDSVDQPQGIPTWDLDFGYGCNNKFTGKTFWRSSTGHSITLNDNEAGDEDMGSPRWRDKNNGIFMETASGHTFEMNDHSNNTGGQCTSGMERQIKLGSTSGHTFTMYDGPDLQQCSPERKDGGQPLSEATQAWCELRTGYGLLFRMEDSNSQQNTDEQRIALICPQYDNTERGRHIFSMQEKAEGPGFIFTRAGGRYAVYSYDDSRHVVGTEDHDSDMEHQVFGNYLIKCKKTWYNENKMGIMISDDVIVLGAGLDCKISPTNAQQLADESGAAITSQSSLLGASQQQSSQRNLEPCFFPLIVAKEPWRCPYTGFVHFGVMADDQGKLTNNSISDRIYGSSSVKDNNNGS